MDEEELPEDACHADAVLAVEVVDEELVDATYDPEETATHKDDAQYRFDRLSRRPPREDES